jgi:hypothetical protein
VRAVLDRANDAEFLADKVLYARSALLVTYTMSAGLIVALFAWSYVTFFHGGISARASRRG